jgi:hypothetical protein
MPGWRKPPQPASPRPTPGRKTITTRTHPAASHALCRPPSARLGPGFDVEVSVIGADCHKEVV